MEEDEVVIIDDDGQEHVAPEPDDLPEEVEAIEEELPEEEPRPKKQRALTPEEKVQKRNAALRKERAKNRAMEQALAETNRRLERMERDQQAALIQRQEQLTGAEVQEAEEEYRRALSQGTPDDVVKANRKHALAIARAANVSAVKEQVRAQPQRPTQPGGPTAEAKRWLAANPDIAASPIKCNAAGAASQQALEEGYDGNTREHFERVDEILREEGIKSARREAPRSTGPTRSVAGQQASTRQLTVPRDVYDLWEKSGAFEGTSGDARKAVERQMAKEYHAALSNPAWRNR